MEINLNGRIDSIRTDNVKNFVHASLSIVGLPPYVLIEEIIRNEKKDRGLNNICVRKHLAKV